jgi:hypothetical protein
MCAFIRERKAAQRGQAWEVTQKSRSLSPPVFFDGTSEGFGVHLITEERKRPKNVIPQGTTESEMS